MAFGSVEDVRRLRERLNRELGKRFAPSSPFVLVSFKHGKCIFVVWAKKIL
jgi:Ethanolamine utilization protein EutJ (predicted chaperonin)